MLYHRGTLANHTGLTRIADPDEDPETMQHIHTEEPDDEDDPPDCGYQYLGGDHPGPFAALCPWCAQIHSDQPWVQRCLS